LPQGGGARKTHATKSEIVTSAFRAPLALVICAR
jgi:hypothetical protein